ncbi:MAG: hypothetical protein LAP85_02475 [Acidobacteriia bacterium]|nr:hypothetical protein [Terriglobia bacterium]
MKKVGISVLAALFLFLMTGMLLAQNADLSGTWVGDTLIPNSTDKDFLTVVLKKDGVSYSGTITDSMGMANGAALEKIKFENGTLSFQFAIFDGQQNLRVSATFKVSGDKMTGSWETESGDTGSVTLERKK